MDGEILSSSMKGFRLPPEGKQLLESKYLILIASFYPMLIITRRILHRSYEISDRVSETRPGEPSARAPGVQRLHETETLHLV